MFFGAPRVAPEKVVIRPTLAMSFLPGTSELQMATYFEKLKDPRWQKKRLEVLSTAAWTCASCNDKTQTLHVHHRQYFKGREPWEYEVGQLEVLCEACHGANHESEDHLLLAASYVESQGRTSREITASLIAGFSGQQMNLPYVSDPDAYMWGEVVAQLNVACTTSLTLDELSLVVEASKTDLVGLTAAIRSFIGKTSIPTENNKSRGAEL